MVILMMLLLIWAFLYVFISKSVGKLLVFRWLSRWWLKKFAYIVWYTMKWKLESYIHSEAHSSFFFIFFLSRVIIIYRVFFQAGDDWKSLPTLFDLPWNGNLNLIFTLRLIDPLFYLSRVIMIYRNFLSFMMIQNFCLHCLIIEWYLVKIIPFWGLPTFILPIFVFLLLSKEAGDDVAYLCLHCLIKAKGFEQLSEW